MISSFQGWRNRPLCHTSIVWPRLEVRPWPLWAVPYNYSNSGAREHRDQCRHTIYFGIPGWICTNTSGFWRPDDCCYLTEIFGADGETRTHRLQGLSLLPIPIRLRPRFSFSMLLKFSFYVLHFYVFRYYLFQL